MNTKPCKFCGKPAKQVEGRRARKFCSDACRQKDFKARKLAKSPQGLSEKEILEMAKKAKRTEKPNKAFQNEKICNSAGRPIP